MWCSKYKYKINWGYPLNIYCNAYSLLYNPNLTQLIQYFFIRNHPKCCQNIVLLKIPSKITNISFLKNFNLPLNTQDIPFAQIYRIQLYKLRGNCLQSDCIPLTLECISVQPTTLGALQRMHKHRHINQTPCYPLPDPWNFLTVGSSPVLPPSHQSSRDICCILFSSYIMLFFVYADFINESSFFLSVLRFPPSLIPLCKFIPNVLFW